MCYNDENKITAKRSIDDLQTDIATTSTSERVGQRLYPYDFAGSRTTTLHNDVPANMRTDKRVIPETGCESAAKKNYG